jgi:hypothetical protein
MHLVCENENGDAIDNSLFFLRLWQKCTSRCMWGGPCPAPLLVEVAAQDVQDALEATRRLAEP